MNRLSAVALFIVCASGSSLAAQTPDAKQIEVFGQKISYFESGSGPSVILLHGMGSNKEEWRATMATLAPKFHVYALDQVGFGASDKPMINYRVATYVDFLDAFMRKLSIPKASLVGNSMGGWIAAAFAIAHPDEVDTLALVDAAGYVSRPVTRDQLLFLDPSTLAQAHEVLDKVFWNKAFTSDAVVQRFYSERMKAGDSYTMERLIDSVVRHEDYLNDELKKIRKPTLVIWGREDGLLPVSDADAFVREIPGAKKVIIPQCGHAPQIECPAPFHEALLSFLTAQ